MSAEGRSLPDPFGVGWVEEHDDRARIPPMELETAEEINSVGPIEIHADKAEVELAIGESGQGLFDGAYGDGGISPFLKQGCELLLKDWLSFHRQDASRLHVGPSKTRGRVTDSCRKAGANAPDIGAGIARRRVH